MANTVGKGEEKRGTRQKNLKTNPEKENNSQRQH